MELAERACRLSEWKNPVLIGTLAAAYAEAGRFEEAVKTAERARDVATKMGDKQTAEANTKLLELYRIRKTVSGGERRSIAAPKPQMRGRRESRAGSTGVKRNELPTEATDCTRLRAEASACQADDTDLRKGFEPPKGVEGRESRVEGRDKEWAATDEHPPSRRSFGRAGRWHGFKKGV